MQEVSFASGDSLPASAFLLRGIGMANGLDQTAQLVPGLYDALAGTTVVGGRGGVRDWTNDPKSDTDVPGFRPLWSGGGLLEDPSVGWRISMGWVTTGPEEEFHVFESAPAHINGNSTELYWMGQIALPTGVRLADSWDFDGSSDAFWRMAALVNAEPANNYWEQVKFDPEDFTLHSDGSLSASNFIEDHSFQADEQYWYTFLHEPDFEGGELYSIYLSDAPITPDGGVGFDTPTPGACALLLAAPIALRGRRSSRAHLGKSARVRELAPA